jgi:hypothetical protein
MAQQISTNTFGVAKWIVSSDATQGTHTTISSALTASSSGDTIIVRDGTYTEDITGKAGVSLVALTGSSVEPTVTIVGKCTFTAAGTFSISNIRLTTNSDFFLAVTGSSASIVNLNSCYLNCSNNTGISFTTSSSSAQINLNNCSGNVGTTGIGVFASSSAGTMNFNQTSITNSGASTTANTVSAGVVNFNYSSIKNPTTSSSTATLNTLFSIHDTSAQNVTSVTFGGSAATAIHSNFSSGTAVPISAATLSIESCQLDSSNVTAISGAGTVTYNNLGFSNGSAAITATGQTGGTITGVRNGAAVASGFLGERIESVIALASGVTLTNITPANITSISLTPGVWDVSALGNVNGTLTSSAWEVSISTTSATRGTVGNNTASSPLTSNANSDQSLVVPAYRLTLAATTTVYMVAFCAFSAGTAKAYGRLSATRVG